MAVSPDFLGSAKPAGTKTLARKGERTAGVRPADVRAPEACASP